MVVPIRTVQAGAQRIGSGELGHRLSIKTGDELEELGVDLTRTAINLKANIGELKRLDDAKTQFLSITSHELRTPMTPMRAQCELLLSDSFGRLNEQQHDSIEMILRNLERLDHLIADILDISRIESGRLKFSFEKVQLKEIIDNTVESMRLFSSEKDISITTSVGALPVIETDSYRIGQVLTNLLNNAIKFSPQRGKILVEAKLENDRVVISVKDGGIGISPENIKHLFVPFFQVEKTLYRKYGGTGLGLSICKGIIEAQGGKIWVESTFGRGSAFYFTVPLEKVGEVKAIRIVVDQKLVEQKILDAFREYLGPAAQSEFIKQSESSLSLATLSEYVDKLAQTGVIRPESKAAFKSRLDEIFEEK
ncbi:HAMP domain-containing histidine kinase [Candidatus Micrarchaeota archaeon]|nr:HAMP domain-containing histidine kinase [Candidatus Micrarchaeota archaeon]